MTSLTSADIIAEALYAAGVRHAFGIPGGEVLALVDALERAGIRFMIARHENAAGFMAEGAYRATGAPGVLVATVGPGLANGLNSVANADQERVPLIVLSGKVAEAETLQYTHQIFDHQAAIRPFVKATFEAREGACDVMIDKALHIACGPRPGAVHIDLPIPVAKAAHTPHKGARPAAAAALAPSDGPEAARARALFSAARNPILLAGQDLLDEDGGPAAVAAFSKTHNIPLITTYKAKGILPEAHDLALGGHGLSPKSDAVILPLLAQSDCVICVGYDPIEMRSGWMDPFDPSVAVSFAPVPNDHFMHREGLMFQCDSRSGLALFDGLTPSAVWADGAPTAAKAALAEAFSGDDTTSQFYAAISDWLPDGHTVTVDSGAHRILWSQVMQATRPGQLMQSTGLCTMGCGLPLATGYAMSADKPTLAIMGDGCLDMILGELLTLRDVGAAVTVLVFADASYSLIAQKQRGEGYQAAGVDFGLTNYTETARGMGLAATTAQTPEALKEALDAGLASGKPNLIMVLLPRGSYQGLI